MALIFLAILGVYQVLLFFVHAAVYKTIAIAFGWSWPWLAWLFGILSITFICASILTYRFCNGVVRWFYRISAYWFGLIHFLFVGSFAFYILQVLFYHYNYYVSPALLGGISFGGMLAVHTYASWQTQRPKLTRVNVALPGIPDAWRGKRIAFVSDLHIGAVWDLKFTEKIVAKIQAEAPEMILVGGDVFDGVKCRAEVFIKPFSGLHPPQGIYFASGNHEYIGEAHEFFFETIRKAGVRILHNELIDIQGLQVVGVDWKDSHLGENFKKILESLAIDRTKPSILIKHEPNDLPIAEKAGISLELSGHTHAGQIFPLSYITGKMYRGFDYGLKKLGNMMVCTSSGVGTWGPPLRFGTKSEIVIITLD